MTNNKRFTTNLDKFRKVVGNYSIPESMNLSKGDYVIINDTTFEVTSITLRYESNWEPPIAFYYLNTPTQFAINGSYPKSVLEMYGL